MSVKIYFLYPTLNEVRAPYCFHSAGCLFNTLLCKHAEISVDMIFFHLSGPLSILVSICVNVIICGFTISDNNTLNDSKLR